MSLVWKQPPSSESVASFPRKCPVVSFTWILHSFGAETESPFVPSLVCSLVCLSTPLFIQFWQIYHVAPRKDKENTCSIFMTTSGSLCPLRCGKDGAGWVPDWRHKSCCCIWIFSEDRATEGSLCSRELYLEQATWVSRADLQRVGGAA
jgi:hypothetical protein